MKKLIYYPSFEIHDQTWLKFALLYFDQLQPIVPFDGDRYISNETRNILDSTDLIKFCRPDFETGLTATSLEGAYELHIHCGMVSAWCYASGRHPII
jgi:hypothetical protein